MTSHDADGDALTTHFQWTRNGTDISGATSSTLDLSVAGNGDEGDAIRVRATVDDGQATSAPVTSAPVTVLNTSPAFTPTSATSRTPSATPSASTRTRPTPTATR